ncbi:MAG: low-specificity L-threonine aldolase [Pseudomonadota bacterium]
MTTSNRLCDLRSDTVTRPTDAMRAAMAAAEVGDDVYGEDPTVNALEVYAAAMLGKDAALLVSSGTQGNLLALMSHCERGDEYIVGQTAHAYRSEAGGAAVLGSIQPQPLDLEPDGTLDIEKVRRVIKADDFHLARTKLLCLENTHGGKVIPLDYIGRARALCDETGLGFHLDGARVFNAAVKLEVPIVDITAPFDTISFCLSKGLGAPVGSLLCGNAPLIDRARRLRKMLGGGTRQAGILAAAGRIALDHHVERLADDHENAAQLARALNAMPGFDVDTQWVHTNMVYVRMATEYESDLRAFLKSRGILVSSGNPLRLVTHLDVDRDDIANVVRAFGEFVDAHATATV